MTREERTGRCRVAGAHFAIEAGTNERCGCQHCTGECYCEGLLSEPHLVLYAVERLTLLSDMVLDGCEEYCDKGDAAAIRVLLRQLPAAVPKEGE